MAGIYLSCMPDLATRFFEAFHRRNAKAMGACYHPEARFSDPVFPDLDATQARAMWRMLIARGADLRIRFAVLTAWSEGAEVEWQAWYTFGATGRPVHNIIRTRMVFRDGLIVRHVDRFSFWRWSWQALGAAGLLLGWTPWLRSKVRRKAAASLRQAMSSATA